MRLLRKSIDGGMMRVACIAAFVVTALFAGRADAQQGNDLVNQQFGSGKNAPLLLQADEIVYDRQNDRVIAKGNIEAYYNNYVLVADEIVYDQKANTLSANGNVRIKEPDGSVVNADKITLTDNFRDGFIRSLKIVTKDDVRIAASNAYRKDGETTVYENGVYTPCKECPTKPDAPPLWRVKAERVIHKKSEQNIYFEGAQLQFFGISVAYVPYFYTPDPTVKRRSGFLTPSFGHSEDLGFFSETPYYYSISPSSDLTLTPVPTTEAGFLMKSEWRQRTSSGQYRIRAYGAFDEDPSSFVNEEFRGSVDSTGEFSLGSFWKFGWDATVESDKYFRRFYDIDNSYQTDLVSQIYLTGQSDRNYFSTRFYHLSSRNFDADDEADAVVHPVIDYNYVFSDPVAGGELSWNTNVLSLSREEGTDTSRVVTETTWRKTVTDGLGQRYTPFLYARGDLYKSSAFNELGDDDRKDSETLARGTAAAGVEYRYPFVKHTETASHVVEPIAQVIARPSVADDDEVPNEDAQSLVFDDTLLFDIDKFSGYDRIETGTRANVGVQYSLQTNSGWNVRAVAGQSYHIVGENSYTDYGEDVGLASDGSDYVTGIYVDAPQYLRFISQARFDDKELDLRRQDIQVIGMLGPFYASASYVKSVEQPELDYEEEREEVSGLAAVRLNEFWTLFADARYNISDDQFIRDSIGIRYADECFVLSVTYAEQFIEDGEIKPDQQVMLRFELRGFGTDSVTDSIGALSPEASLIK